MLKWMQEIGKTTTVPLRYENYERMYLYESTFNSRAASEGKAVFTKNMTLQGCTEGDLNLDRFNLNAKLLKVFGEKTRPHPVWKVFGWDEGVASFDMKYEEDVLLGAFIQISSTTEKMLDTIFEHFSQWQYTKESTNQGRIYTLTKDRYGSLTYASIGIAKVPFVENNYEESIVRDVYYITDSLQSADPAGRIVLLNGEPGTGKTYLIRSILSNVEKATFLLLSPDLVGQLTGPDLMTFLTNHSDLITPLVLVIEDADACLASRKMDNISLISNLLNISDGIIGTLLDIRIIATTNVENKDIDKAILRPGRLLKRVNIRKLSPERAAQVYKRISGKEKEITVPMTLAEIYFKARDEDGIVEKSEPLRAIGFNSNQPCPPTSGQGYW